MKTRTCELLVLVVSAMSSWFEGRVGAVAANGECENSRGGRVFCGQKWRVNRGQASRSTIGWVVSTAELATARPACCTPEAWSPRRMGSMFVSLSMISTLQSSAWAWTRSCHKSSSLSRTASHRVVTGEAVETTAPPERLTFGKQRWFGSIRGR